MANLSGRGRQKRGQLVLLKLKKKAIWGWVTSSMNSNKNWNKNYK